VARYAGSRASDNLSFVNDTDPRAAAVQLDLLRRAGIERRALMAGRLSDAVIELSRRALREQNPGDRRSRAEATVGRVALRCRTGGTGAELPRGCKTMNEIVLNRAYLEHWAQELGLEALLERAVREAQGSGGTTG
jgi:hypothetical protein